MTPAASVKQTTAAEFRETRERVRGNLGEHYLGMGSILVQRLALPSAEEFNALLDNHLTGSYDQAMAVLEDLLAMEGNEGMNEYFRWPENW